MILTFLIGLLWGSTYGQRRPPNYGQDHMPETSFSCRDKIIGGYYADPETECQMFHVCVKIPGKGIQDFRFLCPNDTSFDQENQICDDWYNIDCEASTLFYSDNFDLYRIGGEFGKVGGKLSPVNNAVGESLDDNYLQRADRGENVPQDLFRGSQSGHFFSNRNGGREDYDDDDYSKPKKKQAHDKQSKQQIKKPQEIQTAAPIYSQKDSRFQHRNSNFRRNHVTSTTTAQLPESTTTQRTGRGQQRQDFYRFRSQGTTTVRPPPQENSYSPTTTTLKPYNNNYQATTLKPFSFNNYQQPTTAKQNYQQNVAVTTVRPNYNFNQFQQSTTAKTYQDISRTYPVNNQQTQQTGAQNNQPAAQTVKPFSNSFNTQQNPGQTVRPFNNNQSPAQTVKPFNQPAPAQTVRPFNNNQPAAQTVRPFNNNQQPSAQTARSFNNNQPAIAQTARPFNSNQPAAAQTARPFNNNQPATAQTARPLNNQQPVGQTVKPFNNAFSNQQTPAAQTSRPYSPQVPIQTQKPQNSFQQNSVSPTNNHHQTHPPQSHNNNYNQFNGNQNYYSTTPHNNYNQAYTQKPQNYNQNVQQTQAPFNTYPTQKSFSQSISESTEVSRIHPNQYNQNFASSSPRNNFNFGATPDSNYNQNYDVAKVTTVKPFDHQRAPNHQYPSDDQDEFLKTAHSQNLGSSLRAKALNVSQAAALNYIPSGTTGKPKKPDNKVTDKNSFNNVSPSQNNFSSQKFNGGFQQKPFVTSSPSPQTFPPQPPQKHHKVYNQTPDRTKSQFNQQPTQQAPQKPQANPQTQKAQDFQQSQRHHQRGQSQYVPSTVDPKVTSPQPFSPPVPHEKNQENQDYDYAYYDSAGPNEYDIGNVEFRRTTPQRNHA